MSVRADYYIEKARYNKDHTRITHVSVREDNGTKLGGAHDMTRDELIDLLRQGKHFMTIFRSPAGKYRKGQKISMMRVDGSESIRTDHQPTLADQLDNLPEF